MSISKYFTVEAMEAADCAPPAVICVVSGVTFYENPLHGDEAPLMVRTNNWWYETCEWDCPDSDSAMDYLNELKMREFAGE